MFAFQSHQFESTYSPTEGYRVKLNELTDGGNYMCRPQYDTTGEFDIHFVIHVNCELNKCHGYATILNDMPATIVVAPISLNQITSTISTPHLMTVTTTTTIASNPMVKQIRSGVGKSSFTKRHISSNTSTASVFPSPPFLSSVLQSNQHMNLYDVEIITTAPSDLTTTTRPNLDDINIRRYSDRRQMPTPPYTMEKLKRKG